MLKSDGWTMNASKVERICRSEGQKVPQKQQKRGRLSLSDGSCVRLRPEYPNHVWDPWHSLEIKASGVKG